MSRASARCVEQSILVQCTLEDFVVERYGAKQWEMVMLAVSQEGDEINDPESVWSAMALAAAALSVDPAALLRDCGRFFFMTHHSSGSDQLLLSFASTLPDFLSHLNDLHYHMFFDTPTSLSPVSTDAAAAAAAGGACKLRCYSSNSLQYSWLQGVIEAASEHCFQLRRVKTELSEQPTVVEGGSPYFEMSVTWPEMQVDGVQRLAAAEEDAARREVRGQYSMPASSFSGLFPFHFILDAECRIVQAGEMLRKLDSTVTAGSHASQHFQLSYPSWTPWDLEQLLERSSHDPVVIITKGGMNLKGSFVRTCMALPCDNSGGVEQEQDVVLFLGAPKLQSFAELRTHGLALCDLRPHDLSSDFVVLSAMAQAETEDLQEAYAVVVHERDVLDLENTRLHDAMSDALDAVDRGLGVHISQDRMESTGIRAAMLLDRILLQGSDVPVSEILAIRAELLSTNGNRSLAENTHSISAYAGGDDEVNQSLMNLLLGVNRSQDSSPDLARQKPLSDVVPAKPHRLLTMATRPQPPADPLVVELSKISEGRATDSALPTLPMTASAFLSAHPFDSASPVKKTNSADRGAEGSILSYRSSAIHKSSPSVDAQRQGVAPTISGHSPSRLAEKFGQLSIGSSVEDELMRGQVAAKQLQQQYRLSQTSGSTDGMKGRVKKKDGDPCSGVDDATSDGRHSLHTKSATVPRTLERKSERCEEKKNKKKKKKSFMDKVKSTLRELFDHEPKPRTHPAEYLVSRTNSLPHLGRSTDGSQAGTPCSYSPADPRCGLSMPLTTVDSEGALSNMTHKARPSIAMVSPNGHPEGFFTRERMASRERRRSVLTAKTLSHGKGFVGALATGPSLASHSQATAVPAPWPSAGSPSSQSYQESPKWAPGRAQRAQRQRAKSLLLLSDPSEVLANLTASQLDCGGSVAKLPFYSLMSLKPASEPAVQWSNEVSSGMQSTDSTHCLLQPTMAVAPLMLLLKEPTDEVAQILSRLDNWQFDTFALTRASNGRPLSLLGFTLLKRLSASSNLVFDETKLVSFLMRIEDGYPPNPYHCRTHAADVLRNLHVISTLGGIQNRCAANKDAELLVASGSASTEGGSGHGSCSSGYPEGSRSGKGSMEGAERKATMQESLSLLSAYLAAIIHDYQHRGVNNQFLIRSEDSLAVLYNDISPMENHHVAAAFKVLKEDANNFLHMLPRTFRDVLRSQVIELVLATDMKQHFSTASQFANKVALFTVVPAAGSVKSDTLPGSPTPSGRVALEPSAPTSGWAFGRTPFRPGLNTPTISKDPTNPSPTTTFNHFSLPALILPCNSDDAPASVSSSAPSPASTFGRASVRGTAAPSLFRTSVRHATPMASIGEGRSVVASIDEERATCGEEERSTCGPRGRASMDLDRILHDRSHGRSKMSDSGTDEKGGKVEGPPAPARVLPLDEETRMLVWKVALKCADLGHLASSKVVHLKWVHLLEEEMFRQGDLERSAQFPVSPLMDRGKTGITKSQPGFFNVVVLPLFNSLAAAFPDVSPMLSAVQENHAFWMAESDSTTEAAAPHLARRSSQQQPRAQTFPCTHLDSGRVGPPKLGMASMAVPPVSGRSFTAVSRSSPRVACVAGNGVDPMHAAH